VAVNAIENSDLRAGETILITGGGPIGALVALAASAAGASKIFLSEVSAVATAEQMTSCLRQACLTRIDGLTSIGKLTEFAIKQRACARSCRFSAVFKPASDVITTSG